MATFCCGIVLVSGFRPDRDRRREIAEKNPQFKRFHNSPDSPLVYSRDDLPQTTFRFTETREGDRLALHKVGAGVGKGGSGGSSASSKSKKGS